MFKISMPGGVNMSPGSLIALLGFCSLVFIAGTAHTSEPKTHEAAHSNLDDSSLSPLNWDKRESTAEPGGDQPRANLSANNARQRSGRMYQQASGHQSAAPIESYAAAYAAANSLGRGADQSANADITQHATSDANAYSSFGEAPPTSTSGGERGPLIAGSAVRQFQSSSGDYSPTSNYFAGYMSPSSNEAIYSGQQSSIPYAPNHVQHHFYKSPSSSPPLGYPTSAFERGYPMSSYYDRMTHHVPAVSSPFWASTSGFSSGGLMSSTSNAISHWTNGLSIGEIICGLLAIAIGAVILGAPFFLIYLALMGNFSGSGTLSLTNPTSAAGAGGAAGTTPSGRRKRWAVFEAMSMTPEQAQRHPDFAQLTESVVRQTSPFIDLQRLSKTFKQLINSIEKYSPKPESADISNNIKSS